MQYQLNNDFPPLYIRSFYYWLAEGYPIDMILKFQIAIYFKRGTDIN